MHPKGKSIYVTIPPLITPIYLKDTLCPSTPSRLKPKVHKCFEWQTGLNPVSPQPIFLLSRHYPYLQFTPHPSYTSPPQFWLTSVFPSKLHWGSTAVSFFWTSFRTQVLLFILLPKHIVLPEFHSTPVLIGSLLYLNWGSGEARLSYSPCAHYYPVNSRCIINSSLLVDEQVNPLSSWYSVLFYILKLSFRKYRSQ